MIGKVNFGNVDVVFSSQAVASHPPEVQRSNEINASTSATTFSCSMYTKL